MLELTDNALAALQKSGIEPQLILEVDGVTDIYGSGLVLEYIRIGDAGLEIGNDWVIGGLSAVDDQEDLISMRGSSTRIQQQLYPDKGSVSSVTTMKVVLVDYKHKATELVSSNIVVSEIMGRNCRVYMGFQDTAYPEDYFQIFAGFISEIDAGSGKVEITLSHPDEKKRRDVFNPARSSLTAGIRSDASTIPLVDTISFLDGITGPDGSTEDSSFTSYCRIGDEIIRYTGISGGNLTGLTRGSLGTSVPVLEPYEEAVEIESFVQYKDPYAYQVGVANFEGPGDPTNSMFFDNGLDLVTTYGVQVGDYITTTGASDSANNVELKEITNISVVAGGTIITITGVSFEEEIGSSAVCSFYDAATYSTAANTFFLQNVDAANDYGAAVGDYVTTRNASNVFNNVVKKEISALTTTPAGTYVTVSGVSFAQETDTSATVDFISQYEHKAGDEVKSFYTIEGNAIDVALKVMLSGFGGPFVEDVAITNFVAVGGTDVVSNAIFFEGIDVANKYGLVEGDYITTTGASNGANNVSNKSISFIETNDAGSYVVVNDVSFVTETDTSAVVDFRSQYDTLPTGLKMSPFEVDVAQHTQLQRLFLGGLNLRFYFQESIAGDELIDKRIYAPIAAYSLPRKGRSSIGYHSPPFNLAELVRIGKDSIRNPASISVARSISRFFINTVEYEWDESAIEAGTFLGGATYEDATAKSQIPVGAKALKFEASGFRTDLQAGTQATIAANRMLDRYAYAAEFLKGIKVLFGTGSRIEAGDLVLFEHDQLFVSNFETGKRDREDQILEVVKRQVDIKTGDVTVDLVNTTFDGAKRYGLISPASKIKNGVSTTQFIIKESYSGRFGDSEWRKWRDLVGASVFVRSEDFSVSDTSTIGAINGNTITLSSALSFTPIADYIMELDHYSNQPKSVKLLYAFMTDNATFPDGENQYYMI